MVTVTTQAGPLTVDDLDAMPDDGYRRELIDGVLLVTPAPSFRHQEVLGNLHLLLRQACPTGLQVLLAPFDVRLGLHDNLQPDLLVARRDAFTAANLPTAPLLAIEVLSPSTRRFDLHTKRSRYEEAGTASYWVVDPLALTITSWELGEDGVYGAATNAAGDTPFHAVRPFDVVVVPADLRD